MKKGLQLIIIVCAVVSITAIMSHLIIAWLGIERNHGIYWVKGPGSDKPSVFLAGSSLAVEGLSWGQIGDALNLRIEGWGVAGSSPSEWEYFQHRVNQIKLTVFVVSPYDLNEYFLCDFRAEVVPLGQTIKDLRQSRADWTYCKRLLSMYPLTYFRILFPTAGRSDGIMVGVREKLVRQAGGIIHMESEAGPKLAIQEKAPTQEFETEKISNWSRGRILRRLASMRNACQGIHVFNGAKKMALLRMLRQAVGQGSAVVVVLPISPAYAEEFLTPKVQLEFEGVLTEFQHNVPQACWIRLDRVDELNSNDYFWDLVHLNVYGQQIAKEAFLSKLKEFSIRL
jgi:hypothetical protein